MIHEVRLMSLLRWRQFRSSAVYWLRVAGYDPQQSGISQAIYLFYLVLIGLFWLGTILSWAFGQALSLADGLTQTVLLSLLTTIPWLVLAVQVLVLVLKLRSTPLKLSFADNAYVAGSPIYAVVPVMLGFGRDLLLPLLLNGLMIALVSTTLSRAVSISTEAAAVRGVLAAALLTLLTWGAAWCFGLLRLASPRIGRWRGVWLLPLALPILAVFAPDAVLWPGRLLMLAVYGVSPLWVVALLIGLLALILGGIIQAGRRTNLMQAADESVFFARIQALGLMAWLRPQVVAQVYLREQQAARKPFLRLPQVSGWWAIATRAALSYVRHPILLVFNVLWGAVMTQAGLWIVVNNLPVQITLGWVVLVGLVPPAGLLYVYRSDMQERFLRQLLPVDGFALFTADVALPLVCLIGGGWITWGLQGYPPDVLTSGLLFIALVGLLIGLIGAVSLTNVRVIQTRILITAGCFGAMLVGWNLLGTATAALVVALLAMTILSGILTTEA